MVFLVSLCLAGGLVFVHKRNQKHLALLLTRIDQLESHTGGQDGVSKADTALFAVREPEIQEGVSPAVSGDVLAGRTSFVNRVVEGQTDRPALTGELAIRCVHARLEENLLPAELASELSISLRTLERGLAAELGCTPRQLILAMKMREARRLLETGRYRVNEVAFQLGFSDPSGFSRRFRSFYHVSPNTVVRRHAT